MRTAGAGHPLFIGAYFKWMGLLAAPLVARELQLFILFIMCYDFCNSGVFTTLEFIVEFVWLGFLWKSFVESFVIVNSLIMYHKHCNIISKQNRQQTPNIPKNFNIKPLQSELCKATSTEAPFVANRPSLHWRPIKLIPFWINSLYWQSTMASAAMQLLQLSAWLCRAYNALMWHTSQRLMRLYWLCFCIGS